MLLRRIIIVILGAALTGFLALAVGASPGHAAFPGASGRIVYTCAPGGDENLCVINADGSGLGYLTQTDPSRPATGERYPTWSADGRRIAFVVIGDCWNAIYVMNGDRTGLRLVLMERASSSGYWTLSDPAWSPDGSRLVFTKAFRQGRCPQTDPPNRSQIYMINVSGTGEHAITDAGPEIYDSQPAWSPDGASIAFFRGDNSGLWVMHPDGSSAHRIPVAGGLFPDWSPDGTRLVYGCYGICVYAQGVETQLGYGNEPSWSPDGTKIVFFFGGVTVMSADGTGRHQITTAEYGGDTIGHPHWQPCPGACPPAPGMSSPSKRRKPPGTLSAFVGPGFTISVRNRAHRKVKTLVEGNYSVHLRDRSRLHSFHVVGPDGKWYVRTTVSAIVNTKESWNLTPGRYRFYCDAHRALMHGSFRVIADPRGPFQP